MIAIDEALDRLIHRRGYRQAWLDGDVEALELGPDDLAALATIDREQLVRTAERAARELIERRHRGSGGLRDLFPRTIDAWRLDHPEDERLRELAYCFMESEAFGAYRELPFAGVGLSLEEAFFRFAEAADIGDAATREQELLAALLKALAVTPTATFQIPDRVRRTESGFFAVSSRGRRVLFAALDGTYITGALTPFLAEMFVSDEPAGVIAARHGVSPKVLAAAVSRLAALGRGAAKQTSTGQACRSEIK